jgi:hypothetical protein
VARIRTIKPEFYRHEWLYESEVAEKLPLRVAYSGLWTTCDRDGRFKWQPRVLKLDCLPYDNVDFSRVLDALWTRGFVEKYEVDGVVYGFFPSWDEHQVINNREAESNLPNPIESSILTCEARVRHASGSRQGNFQVEGKGKEGKGKGKRVGDATPELTFLQWIKSVPEGEDAVPKEHHVFSYAAKVGIPDDFLELCWIWFEKRYSPDSKKYKDWPKHFRNAVENNWGKLWGLDTVKGEYYLTTAGKQLQLEVSK